MGGLRVARSGCERHLSWSRCEVRAQPDRQAGAAIGSARFTRLRFKTADSMMNLISLVALWPIVAMRSIQVSIHTKMVVHHAESVLDYWLSEAFNPARETLCMSSLTETEPVTTVQVLASTSQSFEGSSLHRSSFRSMANILYRRDDPAPSIWRPPHTEVVRTCVIQLPWQDVSLVVLASKGQRPSCMTDEPFHSRGTHKLSTQSRKYRQCALSRRCWSRQAALLLAHSPY
jgi:hypothetical protein